MLNISNLFEIIKKYKYIPFILIFIVYFILSLLRYPWADDLYYLQETSNIADILLTGHWIGNEAVGLHGFLFKMPAALLFMIFGPSVFIATLTTVILAMLSLLLFYKILGKYFEDYSLKLTAIILISTNYHFVYTVPSFNREIPVLFSLLLFIYLIINGKNKFLIGLSLLLLADAKEHVFFQLMPGFCLWLLYLHFYKNKKTILTRIKGCIIDSIFYFSPVLIYMYLMFFTGIIPYNTFIAYILGLTRDGIAPVMNLIAPSGCTPEENQSQSLFGKIFGTIYYNTYFTKFFHPRMFSFIAIPKIIMLPALITSWITIFNKNERLNQTKLLIFLLFWSYFIIFYSMISYGRYLSPIIPLVLIYFLVFLDNMKFDKKNWIIFIITILSIIMGLLFEFNYIQIKIVFNIILISILLLYIINFKIMKFEKQKLILFFGLVTGLFTFSTGVAAHYYLGNGQIKLFLIHGYCNEIYKITGEIKNDSKIYVNDSIYLFRFYRQDRINTPEYAYILNEKVPKKQMLKYYNDNKNIFFKFSDEQQFGKKLFNKDIDKVIFLYSTNPEYLFYNQHMIEIIKKQKYLSIERKMDLKNKEVYIFNVIRKQ